MEYRSLAHDQVAQFRERGYVRIGKLLDDELVERLRDEYDRVFAEARVDGRYRNLAIDDTDDNEAKANAEGQMLQIMQMCERSILFRQLLYDERILDIVIRTSHGPIEHCSSRQELWSRQHATCFRLVETILRHLIPAKRISVFASDLDPKFNLWPFYLLERDSLLGQQIGADNDIIDA